MCTSIFFKCNNVQFCLGGCVKNARLKKRKLNWDVTWHSNFQLGSSIYEMCFVSDRSFRFFCSQFLIPAMHWQWFPNFQNDRQCQIQPISFYFFFFSLFRSIFRVNTVPFASICYSFRRFWNFTAAPGPLHGCQAES